MGLRDEIGYSSNNIPAIERIAAEMSETDSAELMELISEKTQGGSYRYQASKIAEALRRRGFTVSDRAVQRYRKEKL